MSSEILQLEAKWKIEISSLSYVGELALDKAEFDALCKKLGDNAHRHPLALTVLAVNCAYYDLDYDGFWPHFCARLGVSHTSGNTGKLGLQIERYLRSIRKLAHERAGTYRYVGAICDTVRNNSKTATEICRIPQRSWKTIPLGRNTRT